MYQQFIDQFIQSENLPERYRDDIQNWYLPLTSELELLRHKHRPAPLFLGINGAQGTGKSTLAKLLVALLQTRGLRAINLSIDDFYYSKAERQRLAQEVHPLLISRGVPGTHNMQRAESTIAGLINASAQSRVGLPAFDKASDDQVPDDQWLVHVGPCDVIILEGWFIGARAQTAAELVEPINALEREQDVDGSWREYVNEQLAERYEPLFEQLDCLIMLKAPDFAQVYEWRSLQERKLRDRVGTADKKGMDDAELKHFIQHFERLTRHCLATVPATADYVFQLDASHSIVSRSGKSNSL